MRHSRVFTVRYAQRLLCKTMMKCGMTELHCVISVVVEDNDKYGMAVVSAPCAPYLLKETMINAT